MGSGIRKNTVVDVREADLEDVVMDVRVENERHTESQRCEENLAINTFNFSPFRDSR